VTVTGIEAGILDALLDRVRTFATTLPIAWPDVAFTPVDSYLEVAVIPSTVDQVSLGSDGYNRHRGLLQIDVVQRSGGGIIAPTEIASQLVAHFKRGTAIARNGLTVRTSPPRTAQSIPDDGWTRLPVIVPWFVDTLNPA
jgi:hypothetical protein